ncbi:MAG: flagellar export chaperone FliS [Eubacterium sp.]|nr:flagellar export chaperone FliS [Eubacterium sp.]
MNPNRMSDYQRNAILTASPAELTLMLYEGAIKFCNIAKMAIEKGDIQKAHENIMRAQRVITVFRATLDRKYPVWEDFERVYDYIYRKLVEANMHKDLVPLEEALKYIREMRDTWKEVMRLAGNGARR